MRILGTIALVSLLALGVCASAADAESLSMTFTEDRANVGVQLSDATLFEAPNTAPFAAQIDPGSGSITEGVLQVPEFSTHITDPLNADVAVDFKIGIITGSFAQATGALTLSGEAGGTLTSEGTECIVSTTPSPLTLTTSGNSGGTNPRSGAPFTHGLTGPGAIAGRWTDMSATPKIPGVGVSVCNTVDERIEGPGGIWLTQKGDVVPPSAPRLTGTDPSSPDRSGAPQILGAAESGSTVRIYAGPSCTGTPVATGSASKLAAPGIPVAVAEGVTAAFSATATDPADNVSPCSAPISYTRPKAPSPSCIVPKLAGKTLARAKSALTTAGCRLGRVHKPKQPKGKGRRILVVKSSNPRAGARSANGKVNLTLGPKPRKARR
ncbi:MAG TPA: PASTA domain-containing protein [Solirubrobacterales bacterium]|jgi:hypothetical protein|nr:PASTA domain-containing protein [Solirubrobacterales bacterium]